jgi:hypothetical protein
MSSPLQIGSTFGQYRIDALLGRGGMGVVYRAFDKNLSRTVAIKFLSPEVADPDARRRFQREAQMASSLNHPYILTVHDAGESSDQQFVVTEFVDGGTLVNWTSSEPRSWRQCVELLMGIAEGLAAAHEAHILHRDIKPGNILVSKAGYAKLADFGLAKLEDVPATEEMVTRTGVVVGTPAYMSPEQALGQKCDARSDIFSLGVVLYEALAGKRPFEGKSSPETLQQIIHHEPPPLSSSIPSPLRGVVEKALEKDPADRYQSARELAVDLRRIARRTDSSLEVVGAASPEAVPARRQWWIPVAAVLVVVAVVALEPLFRSEPAGNDPLRYDLAPPPGGSFEVGSIISLGGMALSPDGNTFAYAATVDGLISLWIRPLDGFARRIEGTSEVQRPFWSPDSKTIAFFGLGGLFRVDAAGGAPSLITKAATNLPCSGSWSEDGQKILFSCGPTVSAMTVSNGDIKRLAQPASFPQALPGGAFLYWRGDTRGIHVASIANPEDSELLVNADGRGVYASGYLLWRDGTTLLAQPFDVATRKLKGSRQVLLDPVATGMSDDPSVTVSTTGRIVYDAGSDIQGLQPTWYARTGQRLGTIGPPGSYQVPRLFDNGRRVMVGAGAVKDRGLWLIDERGSNRLFADKVTASVTPSPDGKSMAFGTPTWVLQRADITGDNLVSLKEPSTTDFKFPMDWSGDVLLFSNTPDGQKNDIWSVRMAPDGGPAPGAVPEQYLGTPAREMSARFAPGQNERWLAYSSDHSGRMEIYVRSFLPKKGEAFPISKDGGSFPVWGPGGRQLFFIAPNRMLMFVDVTFGPNSVSASVPQPLFPLSLNATTVAYPYDTVDGERFLVLVPVRPPNRPMQAVNNWPALLKK